MGAYPLRTDFRSGGRCRFRAAAFLLANPKRCPHDSKPPCCFAPEAKPLSHLRRRYPSIRRPKPTPDHWNDLGLSLAPAHFVGFLPTSTVASRTLSIFTVFDRSLWK